MQTPAIDTPTSNSSFSSTLVSGSIYLPRPKHCTEMLGPHGDQRQCHGIAHIYVHQKTEGGQSPNGCQSQDDEVHRFHLPEARLWQTQRLDSTDLHADTRVLRQICAESHLSIVSVETRQRPEPRLTSTRVASANQARLCPTCQEVFTGTFGMPEEWWSGHHRNANGYFGCVEQDTGGVSTIDTWGRFQAKMVRGASDFEWEKIHLFTRWVPSLNQTMIVLLDMSPSVVDRLLTSMAKSDRNQHSDPFWVYTLIADELANLHDESVWAIRTHVRNIEKGEKPQGQQHPDFRRLHDLARHAIHVTETLDVSMQTLAAVLSQHKEMRPEADKKEEQRVWKNVRQRLLAHKQVVDNLRCRSQSNQDRLQNEIQLAFNLVALEDSKTSIGISRAAKTDSTAMKTISILTLIFLPPTFTCAVFSMSFFNYDAGGRGWTVSPQIWIYWAFAVPLTVLSAAMYYVWQAGLSSPNPFMRIYERLNRPAGFI
ncbi:hypothetical protein PG988_012382 [Apiospora saccharicola]